MNEGLKILLYRTGSSDSLGVQLFSVLKLIEALDAIDSIPTDHLIVDWSLVTFIHPAFALPVAAALKKCSVEHNLEIRHENIKEDLKSYLDTIGFFISLESEESLIVSENVSKNYLPFHRFSCESKVSKYSELATSNIREWLNHQGLNGAIKTGISYVISELG